MLRVSERDWVLSSPNFWQRLRLKTGRFCRRTLPDTWSVELSPRGIIYIFVQVALMVGISLTPVVFSYFFSEKGGSASIQPSAWLQAIALAVLQITKFFADRLKNGNGFKKHTMDNLSDMSVSLGHTVGNLSKTIRIAQKHDAELEGLLQHALKCIACTVKLCTNTNDERYFCVSLLTFEPGGNVKIRARSDATRPVGNVLPAKETIAYWVSRYGIENKAVHDFKAESKLGLQMLNHKSLSVPGKPPYVSILVLPLPSAPISGEGKGRKGVVTIDASRCYEFLGRETAIQVRVQAYLELINLLLSNHQTGVEPEAQNGRNPS